MPSSSPLIYLFFFLTLTTFTLSYESLSSSSSQITDPVAHFTLSRRGGAFISTLHASHGSETRSEYVNLTLLAAEQARIERRFSRTRRVVKGNKLVRMAKVNDENGGDEMGMGMGRIGEDGVWYATISLGDPPQRIEMDLDMLIADFYVLTTTSERGSKYDDLWSRSYVKSDTHPFPNCQSPSELVYIPTLNMTVPLSFVHCRPSKSSLNTLGLSGSVLGLAPSESLSQTGSTSILKQLLLSKVIKRPVFSIMLINDHEGVLSVGGTASDAVDLVVAQTRHQLDRIGALERGEPLIPPNPEMSNAATRDAVPIQTLEKRGKSVRKGVPPRESNWEHGWNWSKVQGAEGWWQILMQSVIIDGSKVLQNQAIMIDINSPFILAPPLAARTFYASISGAAPLPAPYSNFYTFPCLNPPRISLEFGGEQFPLLRSPRGGFGDWNGLPGGRFSLGKVRPGSGYCVGAVVETQMGLDDRMNVHQGMTGTRQHGKMKGDRGSYGGNGMKDLWVIGEGFFRGVGGVFDFQEHRVGFRIY